MVTKTLTAVLYREEELYVAECPEVGTVSQGYTVEEAIANLKEATELYLEEFPLPLVSKPLMTTFEAAVERGGLCLACAGYRGEKQSAPWKSLASGRCGSVVATWCSEKRRPKVPWDV